MPDARPAEAGLDGLTIELVAKGGVPQMPSADVELTRVVIGATAIRAIGDAAPGDMRTTRDAYIFEWRDNLSPIPFLFGEAPPGLYSSVELRINDSRVSTEAIGIIGRARRAGNLVPFEISNRSADIPIEVSINTVLDPRKIAVVTIEVDVPALVAAIDWASVPLTADGKLEIRDGDAQMDSVVAAAANAFSGR